MRHLFTLDSANYDPNGPRHFRPSVRGIVIQDGRILMVHSRKYDYYKFPGGGLEPGESHAQALCREIREESGYAVRPDSIREYGFVRRIQLDDNGSIFDQENFYYLCGISAKLGQDLDDYEAQEGFTPEFADPRWVIETNRTHDHHGLESQMFEREARVIEWLMEEGYF